MATTRQMSVVSQLDASCFIDSERILHPIPAWRTQQNIQSSLIAFLRTLQPASTTKSPHNRGFPVMSQAFPMAAMQGFPSSPKTWGAAG